MISRRAALVAAASVLLAAAPAENPAAPIAALDAALLQAMRAGKSASFMQRFKVLAPAIDAAFDLHTILRTSVGFAWDKLPAAQKTALASVFRDFTIASYTASFDGYSGQKIIVLPDQRNVGAERVVATQLIDGDQKTRIDYVMRQTSQGWRAVDVLLDGAISRVAVQRSDFRRLLADGDASQLIASLKRKISQLSDGAL